MEYRLNQDPKFICSGELPKDAVVEGKFPICSAVSLHSVIIGTQGTLYTFDSENGKLLRSDELTNNSTINRIRLDITGEYALVAAGRVIYNCQLYGELNLRIKTAKEQLKSAKGALAERLTQQIETLTSRINSSEE